MNLIDVENKYSIIPITSVSLLVTENCNLGCKYCYEVNSSGHKQNNMDKKTAARLVEFLFEEAKKPNANNHINIGFFGGEPTLNIDVIDFVCDYGRDLAAKNKINFSTGMITNATIMNKQLYNIIRKHRDVFQSCQLSIDGKQHIQDSYRVYKNGTGSFKTIEKNIKYFKELFKDNLNIHGVLNKESIGYLYESYYFFKYEWGVKRLWFLPAKDPNFTIDDVEKYKEQLGLIYEDVLKNVIKTKSIKEVEYYAPLDRILRNSQTRCKPCGAGTNYVCVTANGEIYPCHHIYYVDTKKETKIGDIFNGYNPMRKLFWEQYDDGDIKSCHGCDHTDCYRCVAENFEKYGTPLTQIKDVHCGFMQVDLYYQRMLKKKLIELDIWRQNESNRG